MLPYLKATPQNQARFWKWPPAKWQVPAPPLQVKKRPAPNPPLKKAPLPSSVLQISEPPGEDLIYSKWLNI